MWCRDWLILFLLRSVQIKVPKSAVEGISVDNVDWCNFACAYECVCFLLGTVLSTNVILIMEFLIRSISSLIKDVIFESSFSQTFLLNTLIY